MQLTPWRAIRRATAKKVTPAAVRAFFLLLELNAPTPTGLQTMKIGLLLATLISCSAMATVYSYRDADGNLVFTDEPVAGTNAVEVELSEPTVMPGFNVGNPDTAGGATQTPSEQREDGTWASWGSDGESADGLQGAGAPTVEIFDPLHDKSFWTGNGDVNVAVGLDPGLAANQELAVVLDGRVLTRGKDTQLLLNAVDRGTHSLHVEVRGEGDAVLSRSESITIHVHRPSVINPDNSLMHPSLQETQRAEGAAAAPGGS